MTTKNDPGTSGRTDSVRSGAYESGKTPVSTASSPALGWARHISSRDPWFHALAAVVFGGSAITYCNGRWPEGDAVERSARPLHHESCDACQRALIEVIEVERGLAELADVNARFDVGGEA